MDNNKIIARALDKIEYVVYTYYIKTKRREDIMKLALNAVIVSVLLLALAGSAQAASFTDEQIASAIYSAEGGQNTKYPYGILTRYEHTTPKQACINTIRHARKDFNGNGDFITFLGSRYCPVGAANDPRGLNKNWVRNVKYYLTKGE